MLMKNYDLLSNKAEDFMANSEIEKNLTKAFSLSKDESYLLELIEKAKKAKGLSPIEATSLLLSNFDTINNMILGRRSAKPRTGLLASQVSIPLRETKLIDNHILSFIKSF